MTTELDIAEAEIVTDEEPRTAAAITPAAPAPATALFGTTDPVEVVQHARRAAAALMEVVEEQQLYLEKRDGRRYLNVEAWTLLGSMLQVRAIPVATAKEPDADGTWRPPKYRVETVSLHSKWCKNGATNSNGEATHNQAAGCKTYERDEPTLEEPGHGGYTARVEARDAAGNLIGAADSQCMWEEWKWRDRDAYALQSMAQTRGISKALSGPLRFIVELAGFKGTPAEEIPDDEWGPPADRSRAEAAAASPHKCPVCGSGVYDNRADNAGREERGEKPWPAFKCKNRQCVDPDTGDQWAAWSTSFFEDPTVKAKRQLVALVANYREEWDAYYDPTDPGLDKDTAALVADAQAADDNAQRAGVLWNELAAVGPANPTEPTPGELNTLLSAAQEILHRLRKDRDDVATPEAAWAAAAERQPAE